MYREREDSNPEGDAPYSCSAISPLPEADDQEVDSELEHYILGSWNKGRGLKKNGLMKKVSLLPLPVGWCRAKSLMMSIDDLHVH